MCAKWTSFFDPPDRAGAPGAGDKASQPTNAPAPLTVSDLLAKVKAALGDAFAGRVRVVGEISNFKRHSSGHLYFRLKDADTAIDAVMFRRAAGRVKFTPGDGLEVLAEGRIDVYEAQGRLQFYVERMTPKGQGALELAFRQLREKLQGEGLFDPARKGPLPRFPRAVGVVTSRTGAAIRDIDRTLRRRWPAADVYLVSVHVQGEGAAAEIAEAVRLLDAAAERYRIDTIIVARGGGSIEDLWPFNEEIVARAIFAAATPIISGVGHEVDVSISDMVADVRAATPTAAAELAVPDREEVSRLVTDLAGRLGRSVREDLQAAAAGLETVLRSVVFRDPTHRLRAQMQRTDEMSLRLRAALGQQLTRSAGLLRPLENRLAGLHPARLRERALARLADAVHRLAWALGKRSKMAGDRLAETVGRLRAAHPAARLRLARQRAGAAARQLEALSYRSVLGRGYSVTRAPDGAILRSVSDVAVGDKIRTELADGDLDSQVTGAGMAPPPKAAPKTRPKRGPRDDEPTLFDPPDRNE